MMAVFARRGRLLSAVMLALFASSLSFAQERAPDFASVLEGAKREGSLIVRVTSPGRPETHQALLDAFKKRFGLTIQTEWTPVSSVQTGTRVVAEASGGRGSVDVIGSGGAEEVSVLLSRQLLKPYPWGQVFGKEFPTIGLLADQVMPDLKGVALPIMDAVYGLAWNPQLLPDKDVPSRTPELLDARWKGKIAANAQFLIPFESLAHTEGSDAALDFARKLLENRPVLERGTPAVSRAVSVGQTPLGVTTFHAADRAARSNEPQKFRLFADFIPVYPLYVYVPETAPHPNAARLFAAWLITEGAEITAKFESTPRIGDPKDPLAVMVAEQRKATGAKIVTAGSLKDVAAGEPVRRNINQLLSGQTVR